MKVKIGEYLCAGRRTTVYGETLWCTRGSVHMPNYGKARNTEIHIAIGSHDRRDMFASLLHETFEMIASDLLLTYESANRADRNNYEHLLVMTHGQFTEASVRQAIVLDEILPDVEKAWRKHKGEAEK